MKDSISISKEINHKTIVISAVNLVEGGALSVLKDCLQYASNYLANAYNIVAIVHKKELCEYENISYIEIPWSKKHWIYRLYFEYFYCRKISKLLAPFIWFSLHDITPNVVADRRIVYCHNPSPFNKISFKTVGFNTKECLFALFYRWLYRINIDKNKYVVVQQHWIKEAFSKMFNLSSEKILVSSPISNSIAKHFGQKGQIKRTKSKVFFYPAFPRTFKNFQVICNAAEILLRMKISAFKVILTIDGSENKYSKSIVKKFEHIKNIKFCGILSRRDVFKQYNETDCLIFPSKLETWGLPISEFAEYGKPMIVADLPYAHETAAGSQYTTFFNPDSPIDLARIMRKVIDDDISEFSSVPIVNNNGLVAYSWKELFDLMLRDSY